MSNDTISSSQIIDAEKRIRKKIRKTPLEFSPYLSKLTNSNVYLKLENYQITGSFKVRGAMNKVLSLNQTDKEFVTASTGNHGLAVTYALKQTGLAGTVYLPTTTPQNKIKALDNLGAHYIFHGHDSVDTEVFARNVAKKDKKVFISPYNDEEVICGQGSIGVEVYEEFPELDSLLVSVGGGGLISGIGIYLKDQCSSINIIGCSPKNSPVLYQSINVGKIVNIKSKPTLSDGTAGGVEPDAITFDLCQKYVDRFLPPVSESEIADAIRMILNKHQMVIEGAAGVTIASFLNNKSLYKNKNVVLIICGKNISYAKLQDVICSNH